MANKIELFIQTKEHIQRDTPPTDHMEEAQRKLLIWRENKNLISSIHNLLSEDEKKVKELLEEIASKHNYELIIYDISNKHDEKIARTKGIHKTPTVIIDNHKFEGDFETKDIITHVFGPDASKAGYKDETKKYVCPKCQSDNIKIYDDLSGFCNACNESFMKGNEVS